MVKLWVSSFHTYQKVQTYHVQSHNDVIIVDFAQIADLQWNIDQNWIFRQKVSNRDFVFFLCLNVRKVSLVAICAVI